MVQVSAGNTKTCAVKKDGTMVCWREGPGADFASPPGTFNEVAVGAYDVCGIQTDGTVACWLNRAGDESAPPEVTSLTLEL